MGFGMNLLFITCLLASIYNSNGCTMEGVVVWQLPITVGIEDYDFNEVILQRTYSGIGAYSLSSSTDLNGGPYIDVSMENSVFVLRTNDAFRLYEENETAQRITLSFTFTCTAGNVASTTLTVHVDINDNNNNDPLFKTPDTAASADTTYQFTIAPPVPPGFLITNCISDIIVRDVDLTTYRIDFGIQDNPYIAIEYDEAGSTVDKEFKAVLRTTSFIRTIPEPITLTISATDVDQTGDPPITRTTTVTIVGSSEFELPLEPVFTQAFYMAQYTDNNQITVEVPITLEQGYDEQVQFSLEGDYADSHITFSAVGNLVTLSVTNPLPTEALQQGQIYLVVNAVREYTSGASATIVVQLPEVVALEFERPHYEGEIVDNTLQLTQLILSQGYQGSTVTVSVEDYPSFFTASIVENIITLSMAPLEDNIIEENSFINLRVIASTDSSSATAIVTLDIVKDDVTTPMFGQPLYSGTYDLTAGLTMDPILLVQGYDETVNIDFIPGEYESYFELIRDGVSSTLRVIEGGLPSHILSESQILLSVEATKPRTVGAHTVVSITLPGARELQFEASSYRGTLQDNILTLDTIILNVGYDDDVTFSLSGDYSNSFGIANVQNQVTISLPTPLPQEVILDNNFLMLTVTANALNGLPTTTAVLLEIIKDDVTTPVFSQAIYYGTHLGSLDIDIGNINLIQGYDNTVTFRIDGENSEYFDVTQNGNSLTLSLERSIPEEVIFNEKVFVFNIFADKPLTVGANAAISIKFSDDLIQPAVMQFSNNAYAGNLEHNVLTLENIVLETGYAIGTQFLLSGEYASQFSHTVQNNIVSLTLPGALPEEVLENNRFIHLELEARRDRAVSAFTVIIIEIIDEEIPTPVFSQAYYTGIYTEEDGLQSLETIHLVQGYDETVTFGLEGDAAAWFEVIQNANTATIVNTSPVSQEVLESHHQLLFTIVANKPNTINAYSAISIELPRDVLEQEVLRFTQSSYEGQLDGSELQTPTITLSNDIIENVVVTPSGSYATYFTVTLNSNIVTVELTTDLPSDVIADNDFIVLDIIASKPEAVSGYTALVLNIVKEPPVITPVFEQAYYTGEISEQGVLVFEHTIRLIQGYDESVSFTLDGDAAAWFEVIQNANTATIVIILPISQEVLESHHQLLFTIVANKPNTINAYSAISIELPRDVLEQEVLRFTQSSYEGQLDGSELQTPTITLSNDIIENVVVTPSGSYATYFTVTLNSNIVTVELTTDLPSDVIADNNFIVLDIIASKPEAVSGYTALVLNIVKEPPVITPVFEQAYYTGEISEQGVLVFEHTIRLIQGYDESVSFTLDGDAAAWFEVIQNANTATIVIISPISQEVLESHHQLLFTIVANKPNTINAYSAISIELPRDVLEQEVLRFTQSSYEGQLDGSELQTPTITLSNDIIENVVVTPSGSYATYFTVTLNTNIVTVELTTDLPSDVIADNNFIVLDIIASKPEAVSGYTALVLNIVKEPPVITPVFEQAYYTGEISEQGVLVFEHTIRLIQGYDESVSFTLDGDAAAWFEVIQNANTATIVIISPISQEVLESHHQLLFTIVANKPNTINAYSAISIELPRDVLEQEVLRFTQSSYEGQLDGSELQTPTITLSNDIIENVVVTPSGSYATYFTVTLNSNIVTVELTTDLPSDVIADNDFIVLDIIASKPEAVSGYTALVLNIVKEPPIITPVFEQAYYTGEISEQGGLVFEHTMRLIQGYDESVSFTLDGDGSEGFLVTQTGNSLSLSFDEEGAIQIENISHLVFSVVASKSGSVSGEAAIVIHNSDSSTARSLRFSQNHYRGSLEENVLQVEPIILVEGYSPEVELALTGDYANYFQLEDQDGTITLQLSPSIPDEIIEGNSVLVFSLEANVDNTGTHATVIVELIKNNDASEETLAFEESYYVGSYSATTGVMADIQVRVVNGYDSDSQFTLEGGNGAWFSIQHSESIVTLSLVTPLPAEIFINNQPLIFALNALNPGGSTASTAIIVTLEDELPEFTVLGFERNNYVGTIDSASSTLEPIILNQGYSPEVQFTLHGDLTNYFSINRQDSAVNVVLQNAIPEQLIPANRIIVLDLQATAVQAISATTTIVFEVVNEEGLVFSANHYIGRYSELEGLEFNSVISLDTGYDEQVEFTLEGDQAQWFALQRQGNSVTITLSDAIPPAVLLNYHQLVFGVTAQKANSNTARAAIVISLVKDFTDVTVLGFVRASYLGSIENNVLTLEPIVLNEGYTNEVTFTLHGELASYFSLQPQESTVNIQLLSAIPEQALPINGLVLLEMRASALQAIPATTTVILETPRAVVQDELVFSATHYIGQYSETDGFELNNVISLNEGYDEQVQFALEGDHAQWFTLQVQGNSVTLILSSAIPPAILVNNHQLVFSVTAQKPNSNTARAAIVISLVEDFTDATVLGFERASYLGSIENDVLSIEPIVLNEGYTNEVTFTLHGELAAYFNLQIQESTVNIVLQNAIPEQALPANGLVFLEVLAFAPQAIPATTTVIIETQRTVIADELVFSATHYIGQYSETEGLEFNSVISLDVGYDEQVEFALEGDHAQWFSLQVQGNSVTLTLSGAIPPAILVNNHQLVFSVIAQKPSSNSARAAIVISLVEDFTDATILGFERASYVGSIENNVLSIEPIVLNEGYTDEVMFTLHGDLASYFNLQHQESIVNVLLLNAIPEEALPANRLVSLEVRAFAPQAISATTAVFIEAQRTAVEEEMAFSDAYYTGEYSDTEGLDFNSVISLDVGYDSDVVFTLEGEFAQWFHLSENDNSITLTLVEPVPASLLAGVRKIILTVTATKPNSYNARAVIIISVVNDSGSETNVAFDKVLYEGTINLNVVQHEPITITGYTGNDVEILGVYRDLFSATVSGDTVVVGASCTLGLPEGVTHVALELRADGASAVLIFNVIQSETPEPPTVTFESSTYLLRADVAQTGPLGQVRASASNGETIAYSLGVDNAHLQARVWINSEGEIHLSEFANTGVYSFQVIATSIITQVQGTATVQLTVEAAIPCGDDHTLPPLIILDRDEEEPHTNLVVLDSVTQAGCQYRLNNRWPLDQNWLYVDETGLHALSIDREDSRIAFMALSQVQVELILECDSDTQTRVKRSTDTSPRLDWLGPYDYGSKKWILTDSISYNSRRSLVNLIVNDINDNYPIFVGKENEPIVCGYPIPELEEIVLPRALAELKATDADVGENAALSFWSPEDVLAVAPSTGSVHVRNGATLTEDQLLIISVTDLNGREDGLTGSIQLQVKLIDSSHIAVVTVRNAFLDEEQTILDNLSSAVGYEVKVLSSAVISDDPEDSQNTRNKLDVTSEGASLQLYVYGVIDREPVAVDQLTNDITANVLAGVDVTSTVSLEDYLEGREIHISGGRDTGLLVATIVLSVLLFILILAIAVWFFIRWRKARNYEQFSDASSIASRNEPLEQPPKVDTLNKPRLNIEELKKSERRLQEMLDAPIEEVAAKPSTSQADPEAAFDTIINIPPTDTTLPIVIQSIDKLKDDVTSDEDEYGERLNKGRRKSVVTFNENVEKIIHVEDIPDDNSSDVEVFKF